MNRGSPFSVVFLAGGTGARMGSPIPKQYLSVNQKPLAVHSFEVLASMPEVIDLVVVCEPYYESIFLSSSRRYGLKLKFALPGDRRQDSVYHGIQQLEGNPLVCIHDSARPVIDPCTVRRAVETADQWGAAAIGVKVKSTIKVCDRDQVVVNTPDRASLWEIQTPQVLKLDLLKKGFIYALKHRLTVTDDVSLVELLGKPVKIVEGSYANVKVTTAEDLACIEKLIGKHALL